MTDLWNLLINQSTLLINMLICTTYLRIMDSYAIRYSDRIEMRRNRKIPPLDALRITRRSDMAVIMVVSCFGFGVLPFR